jgi:spoIIIJ-associated protein
MSSTIENQDSNTALEHTERGAHAEEVLGKILSLSQIDANVTVEEGESRMRVVIESLVEGDAELLVGHHGRTLHALQFIANRIVNRFPEGRKPITIEIAGFTDERRARLEALSERLHDCVTKNNVEVAILAMNPADRRTIHMATKESQGIHTFSQDEGIARRLVLTPRD